MKKEEFWEFWLPILAATLITGVYALMPYWVLV